MVLKLLEDQNAEVQNQAVKWYNFWKEFDVKCNHTTVTSCLLLGSTIKLCTVLNVLYCSCSLAALVVKVREAQAEHVCDTLCSHMLLTEKNAEQLRDIAAIGTVRFGSVGSSPSGPFW